MGRYREKTPIQQVACDISDLNFADMNTVAEALVDKINDRHPPLPKIDSYQMALLLSDWASDIVDELLEDDHP